MNREELEAYKLLVPGKELPVECAWPFAPLSLVIVGKKHRCFEPSPGCYCSCMADELH